MRYTFVLVGIPLADALERLIDETELSLVFESALVRGRETFCRAERAPAEALLACVLEGTGLDFVRLSSGTYVLVRDPKAEPLYASLIGQVTDAETGAPLAGASVLLAGEGVGAATNTDGRFAFPALPPGPHQVVVTHVAYHEAADTVALAPRGEQRIAVRLAPRVVLSAPVVVSGFSARRPSEALGAPRRAADAVAGTEAPAAPGGLSGLGAVVGVRLGDALSDVHVQGGASNEQPLLLDGVPVFMPVPNGGFIGPFSPFAVGGVTVQKAGFGASHGSGLSGIVELEHALGAPGGADLTAQVDPLSLNARWSGEAGEAGRLEATWMIALRHSLWDHYEPAPLGALFRRWSEPDRFLYEALAGPDDPALPDTLPSARPDGPLRVGFDDVHAAARLRFGGLRSLYASVYRGTGAFGVDDLAPGAAPGDFDEDVFEDAYHWYNETAQARYEWVQSRRLFLSARAWTTSYALTHPLNLRRRAAPGTPSDELTEASNRIAETGLRASGDLAAGAGHSLSGAVEVAHTASDFALSLDPFGAAPAGPQDVAPVRWRVGAFLEDRVALGPHVALTAGMRFTYLPERGRVYGEPRLALQYDRRTTRGASWAARGAVGRYRQYLHAFDVATYNVTALLPRMRFWLPVGRGQRPPEVYHAAAALQVRPRPAWAFTVEGYYKHQPHLLVLDYGRLGAVAAVDGEVNRAVNQEVLRGAEGYAYGAALSASYERPRLQAEAAYEHDVARRRTPNRFGGAFVPVPWSAPHRLRLALDVRPRPHWTATVRWQGVLGRTWGFRQAYYDFLGPTAAGTFPPFDFSEPGEHRLPAFSQLDVGLAYAREVLGVGVQGRAGLLNVLGRTNVTDWSLTRDLSDGRLQRVPRRGVPLLPTVSLRLSL